jgi:hypothetical protein
MKAMDYEVRIEKILQKTALNTGYEDADVTLEKASGLIAFLKEKAEKAPASKEILSELSTVLSNYRTYTFLKSDRELRIKVPEVWQIQLEQSQKKLDNSLKNFRA